MPSSLIIYIIVLNEARNSTLFFQNLETVWYSKLTWLLRILGPMVQAQRDQREMMNQNRVQAEMLTLKQKEAAKKRATQPTDKTIPDGVEEVIIGDGVQRYKELREVERRLDATMTRKRLDIREAVDRSVKVR